VTDPFTPPLELLDLVSSGAEAEIAKKILQWAAPILRQQGADQELEACCKVLEYQFMADSIHLRTARRPKPPSLKEQALAALEVIPKLVGFESERDAIRLALEALDD
jgi:hypothetical protein